MTVSTLFMQKSIPPTRAMPITQNTFQNLENDPAFNRLKRLILQQEKFTNIAFAPALKACTKAYALAPGKQIHGLSIKNSLSTDIYVQSSLLTMYSMCGETEIAEQVFARMLERDVVSWTAMINAYLQSDQPELALTVFHEMQIDGVKPDCFTVVSILSACAHLGGLNLGRWVHAYTERRGFPLTVFVGTALVDMYCKCGSIEDASTVFKRIGKKSIETWNALLHGLSVHGHGVKAIELFKEMEANEVCPNEVTFVAILCGCSHGGLVEEGRFYFDMMQNKYRIKPTIKHYGCMVDLLARAGMLDEAYQMVTTMEIPPNIVVWGALLSACRIQNDMVMAECVLDKINQLQENCHQSDTSHYVIMSNMYSEAGLDEKREKIRMKVGKKPTGSSWIEIGSDMHEFAVGKTSHPMWNQIEEILADVTTKVEREDRTDDDTYGTHSEIVAVAFGLLMTSAPAPIRITKNLRICKDCHADMKSISKVYQREIIVRDCTRFHRFIGGCCSCRDYW